VIEKGISGRVNLVGIEVEDRENSFGLLTSGLESVVVDQTEVSTENEDGEVEYLLLLLFLTRFHCEKVKLNSF